MPPMEITAKSLRSRIREALACAERGDTVTITYRGKPKARLVGIQRHPESVKNNEKPAGFGMWKDHEKMQDVDAFVRDLRSPRHAG